MLYREIVAVYSQIHTKRTNTLCLMNVELLNAKSRGTYSDHWALEAYVKWTWLWYGMHGRSNFPTASSESPKCWFWTGYEDSGPGYDAVSVC